MSPSSSKKTSILSRKKRQFYKIVVARQDIKAALDACKLFLAKVRSIGDDLYFPLLTAIIVCYSRPFSNNKPFGPLAKKWHAFDNAQLAETHKKILQLRDKTIAHSDLEIRKVFIFPKGTLIGNAGLRSGLGVTVRDIALPLKIFPVIKATCLDLGSRLNLAVEKELQALFGSKELPPKEFELTFDDE